MNNSYLAKNTDKLQEKKKDYARQTCKSNQKSFFQKYLFIKIKYTI